MMMLKFLIEYGRAEFNSLKIFRFMILQLFNNYKIIAR